LGSDGFLLAALRFGQLELEGLGLERRVKVPGGTERGVGAPPRPLADLERNRYSSGRHERKNMFLSEFILYIQNSSSRGV
jgi:hypothetical protein